MELACAVLLLRVSARRCCLVGECGLWKMKLSLNLRMSGLPALLLCQPSLMYEPPREEKSSLVRAAGRADGLRGAEPSVAAIILSLSLARETAQTFGT